MGTRHSFDMAQSKGVKPVFNEFQQRLAQAGFTTCPLTSEQYDLLLAAGYCDEAIESIASDVASGFTLAEACDA